MDHSSSQGTCQQCGTNTGKRDMLEHLRACSMRRRGSNGHEMAFYQLRLEDRYGGAYWLDVELPEEAPLGQLDTFLRRIWLDCCNGHTSAFEIEETHYVTPFDARLAVLPSESDMDVSLKKALGSTDGTFIYDYDFASPTHLMGRIIGRRRGVGDGRPVRLLARNNPIERSCAECGTSATYICSFYHANPFLCDVHAEAHSCGRYALMPVVNSPRMGVCSYQGQPPQWRRAV